MPKHNSIMTDATFRAVLDYIEASWQTSGSPKLELLFHGGEPLLPGEAFWERAMSEINQRFRGIPRRLLVQSNLWQFTPRLADLFADMDVRIGTSLDGPRHICDLQRGEGYFDRTWRAIELARGRGLQVGCIATLSSRHLPQWPEFLEFFVRNDLSFSLHPTLPAIGQPLQDFVVDPMAYAEMIVPMIDAYVALGDQIEVFSLSRMCQGVYTGHGAVCTHGDCAGTYLSFGPDGNIYPCHRFCGTSEYCLGNVSSAPVGDQLLQRSRIGRKYTDRIARAHDSCAYHCEHFSYCKSGCYYNMIAAGTSARRDPYCPAYKKAFAHIQKRLIEDIGSETNLAAIAEQPVWYPQNGLFRQGPMIDVANGSNRLLRRKRTSQRVVAAVALARFPTRDEAIAHLQVLGVTHSPSIAAAILSSVWQRIGPERPVHLQDIFLHITGHCAHQCSHCYLEQSQRQGELRVVDIMRLLDDVSGLDVGMLVFTGGEPTSHSQFWSMLKQIKQRRHKGTLPSLFLSTSLAGRFRNWQLQLIMDVFDQIGVSVDGDRIAHDQRRGKGSYDATVGNLRRLAALGRRILLGCTIAGESKSGLPHVFALAQELGLPHPKVLPLLPLGQASGEHLPLISKNLPSFVSSDELLSKEFLPRRGCLGSHLHVDSNGDCYPCYACRWKEACLGNIAEGTDSVLTSQGFNALRKYTVDANPKCQFCEWRYLCGGACLAWQRNRAGSNCAAEPPDCKEIQQQAKRLYASAIRSLQGSE